MSKLFEGFRQEPDRYNEIFRDNGSVRTPWKSFMEVLDASSPEHMQQRYELVDRQIQENGVTYNVYGDAQGTSRPWRLAPLPNLLDAEEWRSIASAISQRAGLLNKIIGDIYGEQTLLKKGLLPAELIFGHNNYLHPCKGIRPPGNMHLHIYAADIVRSPDGRWWVMADRTQAPSGAGYALENRHIIARAFPDLYRRLKVQKLTQYFQALQHTLARLAPHDGEPPLTVLLTPGRYNETYFEHVFLARHLGIPLVEGQDLTVRHPCVYLKTLNGLKRVHAILRRQDDDFCDPLELRNDSTLGVPGLLGVARAGNVLIANALGSGVLESPGLHGFLPGICEELLSEELEMPSLATWWCGEPPALEEAVERLPELVIKPAFPSQSFAPVFGNTLDEKGLATMRARLRARPYVYVAQETVKLAHAPVWHPELEAFRAHATGMRVYAVATETGYLVMPGGLTRVAANENDDIVSMQRGGLSKDTWVCFSEHSSREEISTRRLGVSDLLRQDPYLPSRVAENMFWLGRYAERCDNNARLLRSALSRQIDLSTENDAELQLALEHCLATGLTDMTGETDPVHALLTSICDNKHAGSLAGTLRSLIWCASQVRSRLSHENWIAIIELEQELNTLIPASLPPGTALAFLDRLLMSLSALAGFAMDDMTQDNSWRFLMIGRRLERLQFLSSLTARLMKSTEANTPHGLDWLLEMADSRITYRSRYLSSAQLIPVIDLVMLDPANPHSLIFQLNVLLRNLGRLGDQNDYGLTAMTDKLMTLNLAVVESEQTESLRLQKALLVLSGLLEETYSAACHVSEKLSMQYFAHIDSGSHPTASS